MLVGCVTPQHLATTSHRFHLSWRRCTEHSLATIGSQLRRRCLAGQRFDRPARGPLRRGCRVIRGLAALLALAAGCASFDVAVVSVRVTLNCIVRYGHPVAVSHWETISPTPP